MLYADADSTSRELTTAPRAGAVRKRVAAVRQQREQQCAVVPGKRGAVRKSEGVVRKWQESRVRRCRHSRKKSMAGDLRSSR